MSVTDLPSNVLVLLADHLTVTEILSLQRTCVTFREIFDSTMVWRSLFMRDFGWLLADMQLKDGGDYKLAYCKIAAGARAFTTGENEGPSDWGVPTQPPFVSFGQLGSPEGGIVPNLKRIKQVAAGGFHSFFLDCEGRLFSCGANAFGQLGLGDRFSRQTPCLVPMMDGVMSVSCGYAFSMAQTRDGRVFACGFAKNGRCGIEDSVISSRSEDGFPILLSFSPCCKEISSLGRLSFSCGSGHTVALASGGRVFTWGRNDQGQCG
jgi:hypothetical protein